MYFSRIHLMKALPVIAILVLAGLSCGCVTYSIGNVEYKDGNLGMDIVNSGDAGEVAVQVTIFDLSGFRQVETGRYVNYVDLEPGSNRYDLPLNLTKGPYKVYLYILEDGKRSSAVIRNIEV